VLYASHLAEVPTYAIWRVPVEGPRETSLEIHAGIEGEPTQLEQHGSRLVFLTSSGLYAD